MKSLEQGSGSLLFPLRIERRPDERRHALLTEQVGLVARFGTLTREYFVPARRLIPGINTVPDGRLTISRDWHRRDLTSP